MANMDNIAERIQELTAALRDDYNSLSKVIESRRKLKKLTGLSDSAVLNRTLDLHLEKISAFLFPEENREIDDTDTVFLDIALTLLKKSVVAKGWEVLMSDELQNALNTFHVRINDNFSKRQELLQLQADKEKEIINNTPSTSHETSKETATTSLEVKKAATNKSVKSSRKRVLIKKKEMPQKETNLKQENQLQWKVQLREKKKEIKKQCNERKQYALRKRTRQ